MYVGMDSGSCTLKLDSRTPFLNPVTLNKGLSKHHIFTIHTAGGSSFHKQRDDKLTKYHTSDVNIQ